jgi:hypothetical protein
MFVQTLQTGCVGLNLPMHPIGGENIRLMTVRLINVVHEDADPREAGGLEGAFQTAYPLLELAESHQRRSQGLWKMVFARTPQVVGKLIMQ